MQRRDWLNLGLVLMFAIVVRASIIARPFHRNPEAMGSYNAILGRNYLHNYQWTRDWGVPVQSFPSPTGDPPTYYANHPPLVPLLVALSYSIFSEGEWQTRLTPALCTLGCIVVIYTMLRERAGPRAATLAALLFAATPMAIFFGGMADVINSQVVLFALLTVAAYLRFSERTDARRLLLLIGAFALAALSDWPAFFLVPVLCVHFVFTHRPRQWGWIFAFGFATVVIFFAIFLHITMVTGNWTLIQERLLRRSVSTHTDSQQVFDWGIWLKEAVWGYNVKRHTIPLMLLGVAWMMVDGWRIRRTDDPAATPVRLLLAWALVHVVVGRQGVLNHDWWWWVLTPGLAMAAALNLDRICRYLESRGAQRWAIYALVVTVGAWCAWTTWTTVAFFYNDRNVRGGMQYTIVEIGRAIELAAPEGGAVILAENDDEPSMWYYGRRPIKMNVWDAQTLDTRMRDGLAELPFDYSQPWRAAPTGLVFPKQYEPNAASFLDYLKGTYRLRRTTSEIDDKFLIFDLTTRVYIGTEPSEPSIDPHVPYETPEAVLERLKDAQPPVLAPPK
jgi:4-amino-4-deoxy-L-arabinose transferase-like glycosyltransferase